MKKITIFLMLIFLLMLGGCTGRVHPTAEIIVDKQNINLQVNQSYSLGAKVINAESTLDLSYRTSDQAVATVANNGLIVAKKVGVAEITIFLTKYTKTKTVISVNVLEETTSNTLNIFTLNDFHGAVFLDDDEAGISRIGKYLLDQKTNYPHQTILISAGDMFQGSAVSSLTRGGLVVDAMNAIGFDAMTIGNHEFDWGVEGILRFIDGDPSNKEASFPMLGANIYQISKNGLAPWAQPYTVITRGNVKIGIIGLMGESQKRDILASFVEDYLFTDKMEAIKKYTKILRNEEDCDIVIVSIHDDSSAINSQIANLSGEYHVDAVINGHTHRYYAAEESRQNGVPLPYVQAGDNGRYIGKITLTIDPNTKKVIDVSAENIRTITNCPTESPLINEIINNYPNEIAIANEVLGTAGQDIYKEEAITWAATALAKQGDSQIGIINSGGIRSGAFPINNGSTVTYGHIFKMMPFENKVVTLKMTG
ncbi:MAG TPA: 5'-nucleotidase C-terminal domain-containing protein, partial [Bacilli bacterium]|nr:5'-nucleotidase C-terminal domain-containing protein [Bacilli bacterium]